MEAVARAMSDPAVRIGVRIAAVVAVWLVARVAAQAYLRAQGRAKGHHRDHIRGVAGTINRLLLLAALAALILVGGVELADIGALLGGLVALVGVALFAHWSVLSNITASLILYLNRDIHLGDTVRILDGDNSVEGTIIEFGAFAVVLRRADGAKIVYPNTLAIQRPMVRLGGGSGTTSLAVPQVQPPP